MKGNVMVQAFKTHGSEEENIQKFLSEKAEGASPLRSRLIW